MNALVILAALAMTPSTDPPATTADAAAPAPADAPAATAPDVSFELGKEEGIVALGAGIAFTVTSMAAFNAGFEAERQLRAGEAAGDEANDALGVRKVAALVAWPTAVLAVAGIVGGGWLIAEDGS